MNKILTILTAAIIGTCAASSALASDAYYGKSKSVAKQLTAAATSFVQLDNNTDDEFTVYATYKPTGFSLQKYLGPIGSGKDIITFVINSPDRIVCLDAVRNFDGLDVNIGCYSTGEYALEPAFGVKKGAKIKPLIKTITKE